MKNYKIKVNGKDESKEVQELFESLGYEKGACSLGNYPAVIVTTQDWATGNYCSTRALGLDIPAHDNYTEITLAELRDMVVLKRNDVNDANYIRPRDGKLYFVNSDQTRSYYMMDEEWTLTKWDEDQLQKQLKPIEKTMKEYINKATGEYRKTTEKVAGEQWVEVDSRYNFAFKKTNGDIRFSESCFNSYFREDLLWHRPTQPEELPFIDDEPQSLNDQYAEIEQARQHSHYKKDVSNFEFVDVYRVLKLFDVTDPCLQHAIKKLLCSGQRGAKSSGQDVQEAIDSLVRFQQMRIEDSLD